VKSWPIPHIPSGTNQRQKAGGAAVRQALRIHRGVVTFRALPAMGDKGADTGSGDNQRHRDNVMGMFDTFRVVGPNNDQFKNGAGQVLKDAALQSKSFDCNMNTYYLWDDQLYVDYRSEDAGENFFIEGKSGSQCLVRTFTYKPSDLTGRGRVYCQDGLTKPVLALIPNSGWAGHLSEHWAWCEWDIDFKDGKMVHLAQVKAPTRDDLFKEVQDSFEKHLIADDHPVAIKHFYDLGFSR
jgi:hypothetical protein